MFSPDKWKAGLDRALYLLTTQDLKSPQSAGRHTKASPRGRPSTRQLDDLSPQELTRGELHFLQTLGKTQPSQSSLVVERGPKTLAAIPAPQTFDLIYLPQVQLASIPTVGGRIEFLASLREKCSPNGHLLLTPAIASISPFSPEAVASALLKIKWRKFPGAWSQGDTLRPVVAAGRPKRPLRYFHYYRSEIDFTTELQLSGWQVASHKRGTYLCRDEAQIT